MKKKLFSAFLCLCSFLSLCPESALAAGDYAVAMTVEYPWDYEGARTGGIRAYDPADGSVREYRAVARRYVSAGEVFYYQPLELEGHRWSLVQSGSVGEAVEIGGAIYFTFHGNGQVTLVYESLESELSSAVGALFNGSEFLVELTVEYPDGYTGEKLGGLEELRGGQVYERYTGADQTIVGRNLFVCRAIRLDGMVADISFSTSGNQGGVGETTVFELDGNGKITVRYAWQTEGGVAATELGDVAGRELNIQYPEGYEGEEAGGLALLDENNRVVQVLDEPGEIVVKEPADAYYGVPLYIEGLEGVAYADLEAGLVTVAYKMPNRKSALPTTPAPGEPLEGPSVGNANREGSAEASGEDPLHTGPYKPSPGEPLEGP